MKRKIKTTMWVLFWAMVGVAVITLFTPALRDDVVAGMPPVKLTSDKCYSNCTDPNAPTYDTWGNQFSATGTLIYASCPNVADPISGKDNPECVCPDNQYIQGYDKNTNQAVCAQVTGCPYGDAIPLGAQCEEAGKEQIEQQQTITNDTPVQSATPPADYEDMSGGSS